MSKYNDEYDIAKAFEQIENEIITSMMRNMDHHRAEELAEGYNWSQWQVEQLAALEKFKKTNTKRYSKKFKEINKAIDELIRVQRQAGNGEQEAAILKAIKNGFKARKTSRGLMAEFFKINDRALNSLIEATTNDMKKAETAMLRMANDQYRKAIFNAQMYATTGATYEKAVDMAVKDFLLAGINCVEYKNGARHTVKDYAHMAIQTAKKRAYLRGEGEVRKKWGVSTVIMNKRTDACPKCMKFAGKILIDDVWSGGSSSDGEYPLMSKAIEKGLYHPRCRDVHTTYFEGISTPPDSKWTQEEIKELTENLKDEAQQNYAKNQSEKWNRLAANVLDEDNKKKYGARAKYWADIVKGGDSDGQGKSDKTI